MIKMGSSEYRPRGTKACRTVFNELAAMSPALSPSVSESRCEYCGTSGKCAVCGTDDEEPQMSEAGYQALWRALVEPGEWDEESDPGVIHG